MRALIPEKVRALPHLSLGVAVLWTAAFLVLQLDYAGQLRDTLQSHEAATRLVTRESVIKVNPEQMRVVRAVNPDFENDALLDFMRGKRKSGEIVALQMSFDELAGRAQAGLSTHPFRTAGHVPIATTPHGYLSYFLLHAGFAHFATTLLVFLLVGPLLESTWGAKCFGLGILLLVPIGALVHSLAFADSQRALIGGSTLVAGLVGATLVRFWGEDVEPLEWLSPIISIDVRVPVVALGAVWLGYEALLWVTVQGTLPPVVDNDPGYVPHAAAALLGSLIATGFAKFGLEKPTPFRFSTASSSTTEPKRTTTERFDLSKVVAMRNRGADEEAFELLASEVTANPLNRSVVTTYWEMAVERSRAMEAAPIMKRLLEEEMRRGAKPASVRIWHQLTEHAPDFLLDPETLFKLVPLVREAEGKEGAVEVLRQVVDRRNHGFTAAHAAKVARWTAEIDPELSAAAAQRALDSLDLEEKEQAELEMLAQALDTTNQAPTDKKVQSNAFFEESDRSAFGSSEDLSDLTGSFPDGAVTEATPRGCQDSTLTIQVEGREPSTLALSRIRAISIVAVRGLSEMPVVLFDVLVDGRGTERPLSVIRFRCDRFDSRCLAPEAKSPREALQVLLQKLLAGGNTQCLVDATTQKPGPDTLFDSLDSYHVQVLRPASGVLG